MSNASEHNLYPSRAIWLRRHVHRVPGAAVRGGMAFARGCQPLTRHWRVTETAGAVCVQVAKALTYFQFEDVAPAAVLRKRTPAVGDDSPVMYLISWRDDSPDSWVPEEFVSDEVRTARHATWPAVPSRLAASWTGRWLPGRGQAPGLSLPMTPHACTRVYACFTCMMFTLRPARRVARFVRPAVQDLSPHANETDPHVLPAGRTTCEMSRCEMAAASCR